MKINIPNNKVKTWLKLGDHFFVVSNIRGMVRKGKSVLVHRHIGDDVLVNVEYDRIKDILKEYFDVKK